MAIDLYWEGRLRAGFPIRSPALCTEGYDVRSWAGKTGVWPRAVARQTIYQDYMLWHQEEFLPTYAGNKYFQDNPKMIPDHASELQFFVVMGPWIYLDGKNWHVKNYSVKKSERWNGEWVHVKSRRYFIRLVEIDRHTQVFEARTGRSIRLPRESASWT